MSEEKKSPSLTAGDRQDPRGRSRIGERGNKENDNIKNLNHPKENTLFFFKLATSMIRFVFFFYGL